MTGRKITIELDTPLRGHNGEIKAVVLREPRMAEYFRLGDPWTIALSEGKVPFTIENGEAIEQYVRACVVEPADFQLLEQGGLQLARKLKEAVLSFFQPGTPIAQDTAISQMPPTTSPSTQTSGVTTLPPSAG